MQFERDVAILFREIFPEARRKLENHEDDAIGVDLQGTGPYKIQCKKYQGYAPLSKIEEIQCDPWLGDVPILVTAADGKPALAALPLEDLIKLIQHAEQCGKHG